MSEVKPKLPELSGDDWRAIHRKLAVDLFNQVRALLEKPDRTPLENDEMIHASHASRHHWGIVGQPVNLARGEWEISHVYAALGRAESARIHAQRSLELCRDNSIADFDLAFAHEALARAAALAGDAPERDLQLALARDTGAAIADKEDRDYYFQQLATVPGA
jgi:hypothetical protein